jgi:prophage DNA circulation protein
MAYDDRLRSAEYTAPSGERFELQFDDLERAGGKKAAVHEFPQQDAASVQDLGNQAEKFPMAVYFTGADYDTQADAFWSALGERGPGSLQHPRYGDIPVLPIAWTQAEKLVDGLGRADFKVEFLRVLADVPFPITSVAIDEAVGSAVAEATEAAAAEAAGEFDPENAADLAVVKAGVLDGVQSYQDAFAEVTAVSEEIQAESTKAVRDITGGIDDLLAEPLTLFTSLANLARLPARVLTSVVNKLKAYNAYVEAIVQAEPLSVAQATAFVEAVLYGMAGATEASTIGALRSRGEAIAAADALETIGETVAAAIEAAEAAVPGFRTSPETMTALIGAASAARASLLERAYSLRAERRVTLASDRTPLDLVAEFYGGAIDELDAFIESNGLTGDEIILVPAGREVVYYA